MVSQPMSPGRERREPHDDQNSTCGFKMNRQSCLESCGLHQATVCSVVPGSWFVWQFVSRSRETTVFCFRMFPGIYGFLSGPWLLQLYFRQVDTRFALVTGVVTDVKQVVVPDQPGITAVTSAGKFQNSAHLRDVYIDRSQ